MNRIKALILGSAALATVAMVSAPMAAAPDGAGPGRRPFARGAHMRGGFAGGAPLITIALNHKSELNLSSDQVANLEKIKSHYQSQVTPLHQQVQVVEKEIASSMEQTPANLIQLKSKIQQAEKVRSELRYLRVEALENGKSVLSAAQQSQLKSLMQTKHEQMRGQRGQPS
jgi:Spy/CpxP family protein refolding chaperone